MCQGLPLNYIHQYLRWSHCLIIYHSKTNYPMMYALYRAIDIKVGRPFWGKMSSLSPNMLQIPHLTRFNPLRPSAPWDRGNKNLKKCCIWFYSKREEIISYIPVAGKNTFFIDVLKKKYVFLDILKKTFIFIFVWGEKYVFL